MKKTLSFLMALVMLFSIMALPTFASAEGLTLKVEVWDRNIAGLNVEDCWQLNYVKENFCAETGIDVQFVAVSRWDEGEVLTTQLAGGVAPDICITYQGALVSQYIDMGGVYDLTDLVAEHGANIKAFLGETLLGYGAVDTDDDGVKEQYYIPCRRISVANVGNFIRQDWLDKLGMEAPTNIAEYEKYLYGAKEQNLGGEMTIPHSVTLFVSNPWFNARRVTDAFVDLTQVTERDWVMYKETPEMLPGTKEGLRTMNKWYNDGVLYESYAIDTDNSLLDTYHTMGYTGLIEGQPEQAWRTDKSYQQELEKNVEGGKWIAGNYLKNEYTGEYLHDIYDAAGLTIFVPGWVSDEVAEAAVKYIDWMCEPDNMFAMQHGTDGINYFGLDENGIPMNIHANDETVPDANKLHAGDICWVSNGYNYNSDEKNAAAYALGFPGYEEEVAKSVVIAMTDTWTQISFTETIEAETDYQATIRSKQGELITQCLTCKPEDFDATFDKYVQAVLDSGADELIEAYGEAYDRGAWRGSVPASIKGK